MSGIESGKKARREHARETARIEREALKRRQRRNRMLLQGGIIVAVLAVVAVIALVVSTSTTAPTRSPANMASDGILFTGDGTTATAVSTKALAAGSDPVPTDTAALDSAVNIVTYLDYACPYCNQFETTNAEQIDGWVTGGQASLEIHPIAILDRQFLGTKYSTRAANAAACVASLEPDAFRDVNAALFANQPKEGTSGLSDKELTSIVAGAGASSGKVASCISDRTYGSWVTAATERATSGELASDTVTQFAGTPLVLVNGQQYTGALDDAAAFATFVQTVAAG
jgi:protein-disulfide isomerase